MANYWAAKGWPITIVTFSGNSEAPFYELNPSVARKPLGLMTAAANPIHGVVNNLRRAWTIRRAVKESMADAVISFMDRTNIVTLLATLGMGVPVVISERIDPTMQPLGGAWSMLRNWSYGLANCIVVQTARAGSFFPRRLLTVTRVIPNPVLASPNRGVICDLKVANPVIVGMGRLEPQKGFDLLLQAFAPLKDKYPEWNLIVLGEGALRRDLEVMARGLGLTGRVTFAGRIKNPDVILRQGDIFVLSSRYEGFPNALTEAMAVGLPVISFDCRSGPREIIEDGTNGLLVPPEDVQALTGAMERLMKDREERVRLGKRAMDITERFGIERVLGMWEALLKELVGSSGNLWPDSRSTRRKRLRERLRRY